MALNAYLGDVYDMLHDLGGQFYPQNRVIGYVNAARVKTAQDSQCIRQITPSGSGVIDIVLNPTTLMEFLINGTAPVAPNQPIDFLLNDYTPLTFTAVGANYTDPTVVIDPPTGNVYNSVQATAVAFVSAGVIVKILVTNPGSGYVLPPNVTITDPTGTGASATAVITPAWHTVVGQEVYKIADAAAIITASNPAIASVIGIQSIAISWGSFKPVLGKRAFTAFQAFYRSINTGSTNTPSYWAQVGEGVTGNVYLYPIPSQIAQMEWDCYCLPIPLVDDTTPEALPVPWTELVPYYACYKAYLASQRMPDAQGMLAEYKRKLIEVRASVDTAQIPDIYNVG